MDLKTHTAYPEIQVAEVFDWTLEDESGRVAYPNVPRPKKDRPNLAPKGATFVSVSPWSAKIIGQLEIDHDEFVASGGDMDDYVAPVFDTSEGEAATRREAIDEAKAWVISVQDEYLREAS